MSRAAYQYGSRVCYDTQVDQLWFLPLSSLVRLSISQRGLKFGNSKATSASTATRCRHHHTNLLYFTKKHHT